ncbi:MAG: chorismate mutase [Gaiellaceae bacterium]
MSELEELRKRIGAVDRTIVDAMNQRLEIVTAIKRHKAENGIAFVNPERERALIDELAATNAGPLSPAGLEELVRFVLDLCKRELA